MENLFLWQLFTVELSWEPDTTKREPKQKRTFDRNEETVLLYITKANFALSDCLGQHNFGIFHQYPEPFWWVCGTKCVDGQPSKTKKKQQNRMLSIFQINGLKWCSEFWFSAPSLLRLSFPCFDVTDQKRSNYETSIERAHRHDRQQISNRYFYQETFNSLRLTDHKWKLPRIICSYPMSHESWWQSVQTFFVEGSV